MSMTAVDSLVVRLRDLIVRGSAEFSCESLIAARNLERELNVQNVTTLLDAIETQARTIEAQERTIAEAKRNMEIILAADFNLQTERAALTAENEALRHDIAQYVQRDSDRLREINDLRNALCRALTLYDNGYLVASRDGSGRVTHTMSMLRITLSHRDSPPVER